MTAEPVTGGLEHTSPRSRQSWLSPLAPTTQARHKSPFEVTAALPCGGTVIAPSCPGTASPRSQPRREADVASCA